MATILTSDGCQEDSRITYGEACCPDSLYQVDACTLACSFISLLPSGPLWDRPKSEALDYYKGNRGNNPCEFACPPPALTCQTLVAYAAYVAMQLFQLIHDAIAVPLREANPSTAVTTLDEWLDRLGWQDCYKTQCRSVLLGDLTPYELMGECGPVFCPVATPPELECAVKRGIVLALTRAQQGGIKNLCWINWVIEPLGAVVKPYPGTPSGNPRFAICDASRTLPMCTTALSEYGGPLEAGRVKAFIRLSPCDTPAGMPSEIWPGVIAAECIVRSLMPVTCPSSIVRVCDCADEDSSIMLVAVDEDGLRSPFAVDTPATKILSGTI